MYVAHNSAARVGNVRNVGVHRIEARGGGIRIARISGQHDPISDIEQAQVAPIAGMKLLAMDNDCIRKGCAIDLSAVEGNIGKPLLLVDDQGIDQRKILSFSLEREVRGRIAVDTS